MNPTNEDEKPRPPMKTDALAFLRSPDARKVIIGCNPAFQLGLPHLVFNVPSADGSMQEYATPLTQEILTDIAQNQPLKEAFTAIVSDVLLGLAKTPAFKKAIQDEVDDHLDHHLSCMERNPRTQEPPAQEGVVFFSPGLHTPNPKKRDKKPSPIRDAPINVDLPVPNPPNEPNPPANQTGAMFGGAVPIPRETFDETTIPAIPHNIKIDVRSWIDRKLEVFKRQVEGRVDNEGGTTTIPQRVLLTEFATFVLQIARSIRVVQGVGPRKKAVTDYIRCFLIRFKIDPLCHEPYRKYLTATVINQVIGNNPNYK